MANTGILFPGGIALIDSNHIERKAREATGDDAWFDALHYDHAKGVWRVTLKTRHGDYEVSSSLGIWDALANALQAAAGREECDPELT